MSHADIYAFSDGLSERLFIPNGDLFYKAKEQLFIKIQVLHMGLKSKMERLQGRLKS